MKCKNDQKEKGSRIGDGAGVSSNREKNSQTKLWNKATHKRIDFKNCDNKNCRDYTHYSMFIIEYYHIVCYNIAMGTIVFGEGFYLSKL